LHTVIGTPDHAWSGGAELDVMSADLLSIEHGVERCYLEDLHGLHFQNLGNLVHGGECQEVIVLFLSDEKYWDDGTVLVVIGEISH